MRRLSGKIEARADVPLPGVSVRWARGIVQRTLASEKAEGKTVSVYLTGDRQVRRVHAEYFDDPTTTDVISLAAGAGLPGEPDADYLGDLIVSVPVARRTARRLGIPVRQELARYLVHGCLHLLGHDDLRPEERARMHRRQEAILETVFGRSLRGRQDRPDA